MIRFLLLNIKIIAWSTLLLLLLIGIFNFLLINRAEALPMNKLHIFYEKDPPWNYVILGSSKAESNFEPSIISETGDCFNFGLPGTGNKIWYYMLMDELENQKANKVIVNVDLSKSAILNGNDFNFNYYSKIPKNSNLYSALSPETKEKILRFPFYFFGNLKSLISESLKDYISLTTVNKQGFRGNLNKLNEDEFRRILQDTLNFETQFEESTWIKTFNQIEKSNDTIYFVLSPLYQSNWNSIDYEYFRKKMKHYAEAYDQIFFLDFTKAITDKNLFYDAHHLNYAGAAFFSAQVKDSITLK